MVWWLASQNVSDMNIRAVDVGPLGLDTATASPVLDPFGNGTRAVRVDVDILGTLNVIRAGALDAGQLQQSLLVGVLLLSRR